MQNFSDFIFPKIGLVFHAPIMAVLVNESNLLLPCSKNATFQPFQGFLSSKKYPVFACLPAAFADINIAKGSSIYL
jgi:hypothetical protein